LSEPGLIASFMTAAYIRRVLRCQAGVSKGKGQKGPQNANDPGTADRAYIRRSLSYSKVVPAPEFISQRRR